MKRIEQFFINLTHLRVWLPIVLSAGWMACVILMGDNLFRALFSTLYLVTVPGYVTYRVLVGYPTRESRARAFGYVVGLSIVALMLIGLSINQLVPLLYGQRAPLTAFNFALSIAGFVTFMSIFTAFRARPRQQFKRYKFYFGFTFLAQHKQKIWQILGALVLLSALPFLAIGGAHTLNNGGTNWLALVTLGLVAVVIFWFAWTNKQYLLAMYPFVLYCVFAAILLGTSMRGWEITGHDVMQEFQVFQLTSQHSLWSMGFYQDAYTACLSITILPTIFERLTGVYDPYIYKLVFQLIFALSGPILFSGLRAYVPRKTAFLAAIVFLSFPTFLMDIMMLNRQEIAFVCFLLALLAGLDRQLPRIARHILMILFLGGTVLSHYSTSYMIVGVLAVALCIGTVLRLARPLIRRWKLHSLEGPYFSIFPPYIIALTIAMVVGWNGLATHTAGNISQTFNSVGTAVTRIINPSAVPAVKTSYDGIDPSLNTFDQFLQYTTNSRIFDNSEYYNDAVGSQYKPVEVSEAIQPPAPPLAAAGVSGDMLNGVYGFIRQAYVGVLALLFALGLWVMLFRRSATQMPLQYAIFCISFLVMVVLQVVLPSSAVDYGLARVIQQGLLLLSLPAVVGGIWLLAKMKIPFGRRFRIVGAGLFGLFLILSGFLPALTGGFKPTLSLANAGFYYEAYYTRADEIQADVWLATNTPHGSRVYADEFARRKLIAYGGLFAQSTLVPRAIPVDSYVYVSSGNTAFNEVPVYYRGQLLYYTVPYYFLNTHKDVLYNSIGVLIYK